MSLFQFEAFSCFAVEEGDRCDRAFGFAVVACSGRDLVEEYLACGIWPLSQAWTVGPVVHRHFYSFERQVLSPVFTVELGDCSQDIFVAETKKEARNSLALLLSRRLREGLSFAGALFI